MTAGSRGGPAPPMPARWIVDGNNLMGSRPDGWWRDRESAARRLVGEVAAWAAGHASAVLVVFDGPPPDDPPSARGVAVRFSGRARRDGADDLIARLVAEDAAPARITVVTSDRVLAARVSEQGARVIGAGTLRAELDAAARD